MKSPRRRTQRDSAVQVRTSEWPGVRFVISRIVIRSRLSPPEHGVLLSRVTLTPEGVVLRHLQAHRLVLQRHLGLLARRIKMGPLLRWKRAFHLLHEFLLAAPIFLHRLALDLRNSAMILQWPIFNRWVKVPTSVHTLTQGQVL